MCVWVSVHVRTCVRVCVKALGRWAVSSPAGRKLLQRSLPVLSKFLPQPRFKQKEMTKTLWPFHKKHAASSPPPSSASYASDIWGQRLRRLRSAGSERAGEDKGQVSKKRSQLNPTSPTLLPYISSAHLIKHIKINCWIKLTRASPSFRFFNCKIPKCVGVLVYCGVCNCVKCISLYFHFCIVMLFHDTDSCIF